MKKHLLLVSTFLSLMGIHPVEAQRVNPPNKGNNVQALQILSTHLKTKHNASYKKAVELALKNGWVINQTFEDGTTVALKGLDEHGAPFYDITYNNTRAAATTGTAPLWPGGISGLKLTGKHDALRGKLGVWDTPVRLTHQEFAGRVTQMDGPATAGDHGTHVAGTMMGAGVYAEAKGMAYGAYDLKAWSFQTAAATAHMAANAADLLLSNHSYGSIAGWRYNPSRAGTASDPIWEWWGDLALTPASTAMPANDWKFGFYTEETRTWDQIAYNAPYYLIVKAAGNNRSQTGPAVGQPYWRFNSSGAWVLGNRPEGISNNNGYDIVSTYGNAKNILTVGAVEPIANGYKQVSDVKISSFSSWGPTDDGRIKPDIVGNGVGLVSSVSATDVSYASMNGTSMSAPNVTGSLFLLQEHYTNLNAGRHMLASTLKAVALHTADEAGRPGPDYIYGWGLLNTERAAAVITNAGNKHILEERILAQGSTYTFEVTASGSGPLVATISWTDPEGEVLPLTAANVNNRTPRLVNDLDVRIADETTIYRPWMLDPAKPAENATTGDNFRDNVEQVFIANAVPGKTYTISISHKGTLQRGPQAYSLVVSGVGGTVYCLSAASNDADTKIDRVSFANIDHVSATGCTTYRDFTNLTALLQVGSAVPLNILTGSCFEEKNSVAKVFVDWNNDGDFDDANELIVTSGVLSGKADFSVMVNVPSTVKAGDFARMRIVLVETENALEVQACGSYSKGETQDYRIGFVHTANDVGVASIVSPSGEVCANTVVNNVAVTLRNYGTASQTNVPVTVTILDGGSRVAEATGNFTGTLHAFGDANFKVPVNVTLLAGKTYTVVAKAGLNEDVNLVNDQATVAVKVSNPPAAATGSAFICGTAAVSLQGSSAGTIFWYDALTGGNLLATGNNAVIANSTANNTYYAGVDDFTGKVGPATKGAFTGGGYNQFSPSILVTAEVPFIISSARLYIGNAGKITFTVTTSGGMVVSRTTLDVTATRSVPGAGAQSDDPADQGAVYPLNLVFPSAGNYSINIEYANGATIFRSNAGVTGSYPFTIPRVMAITNNSANLLGAYYYLYDIQVQATGCASAERTAVMASQTEGATAIIHAEGNTTFCDNGSVVLKANEGAGLTYQWFRNGVAISGATGSSYTAGRFVATALTSQEISKYTVTVTNLMGCFKSSDTTVVTINPNPPAVSVQPGSSTQLCAGSLPNVELRALSNVSAVLLSFQWLRNGVPIPDATASTYRATETGKYSVMVSREPCGSITSSDEIEITSQDANLAVQNEKVTICGTEGSANLIGKANAGTIFWYSAPTGGKLLAVGDTLSTPLLTSATSFYAGINDFSGTVGSSAHNTGGGMTNFSNGRMYFDAVIPFILEKATINVGAAGTMTVQILDKNFGNSVVASRVINLTAGVSEYEVNLLVPTAGKNYTLLVSSFGSGATAYRNNAGNTSYPYTIPGVVSLTGTNGNPSGAFYYFLYNWKVKAAGCATAEKKKVDVEFVPLPTAAISGGGTICQGGEATINLTLSGTAPWSVTYTDGTTPVTIDNITNANYSFKLQAAGTYSLLDVSDAKANCEGIVRGAAEIIVHSNPAKPVILADKATTLCVGDSITLTAPEGFTGYAWSTGEPTRSIKVGRSGNYTVVVNNGNCNSEASEETTVRFQAFPLKPEITVAGPTTFCAGGKVILSAPEGYDSYLWSNGATTPYIEASEQGSYAVKVSNGSCDSEVSEAVEIVVHNVGKQQILASGPTRFCQGGEVVLSAPEGFDTYRWSNGASSRAIVVHDAGSYNVEVTKNACTSVPSDAIVVTVDAVPAKPIVEQEGNVLTSSSLTNNQWFRDGTAIEGATGVTYTMTESGVYKVAVSNGTCTAVSSDEVVFVITSAKVPTGVGLNVYPNPVTHELIIDYTAGENNIVIAKIFNIHGVELHRLQLGLMNGKFTSKVDVSSYASGVYLIKIGVHTVRFVKQ